ncbi:MAG: 23S rRNA (pseudouridine(1915)-N(3))-methyltransferase RlmH [Epulopiscium sp. Nuni2H_MBin003]|nr:MAG: 23S rRNA (pseudouridine(1915)-N(3))-methyltransferase RlmH [Epulopiscium sp. Nuni2H_MBin003]
MKVDILCVGKLKEKYLQEAVTEYSKRLKGYCKFSIIEVADEKINNNNLEVKQKEGVRILNKIADRAYVIVLILEGEMFTSNEFSAYIEKVAIRGFSHIVFVIGGSVGLSDEVVNRADMAISFSKMTFPHQLFRIMLIEQVYRAFKINNNETYHK